MVRLETVAEGIGPLKDVVHKAFNNHRRHFVKNDNFGDAFLPLLGQKACPMLSFFTKCLLFLSLRDEFWLLLY